MADRLGNSSVKRWFLHSVVNACNSHIYTSALDTHVYVVLLNDVVLGSTAIMTCLGRHPQCHSFCHVALAVSACDSYTLVFIFCVYLLMLALTRMS